jgi:pyrroloquinoline quinone biosynthesis protein B
MRRNLFAVVPVVPFVLVLGTGQDGGVPQLGGVAPPDLAARRDPAAARTVASLLIVDPVSRGRWLIDASPDVARQLERAEDAAPRARDQPLLDGVFLTHAHVGHYLGLAQFGREVLGARELPVHGTARMRAFLTANGPWDLLVRLRHIDLRPALEPDRPVVLSPRLTIVPFAVPHRDEYTDTVGYEIRGPGRKLLYIPDIDKWERWDRSIVERVAAVDVALLDGTFFGDGELVGRSMAEVPHPFIVETLARFAERPASERRKIVFTHLNHTNPAGLAGTAERARVAATGMSVAHDGLKIDL